MNDLNRLQDAFMKADALAQKGDAQAANDAKMFADEIRRIQQVAPQGAGHNGFMGQVNKGIANTVGGVADFINPFDNDAWGDIAGGKFQTGSAVDGLAAGMNAVGADVATEEPDGFIQGLGRGTGNAAGALIPAAKITQVASKAPGIVGAVADDAFAALSTKTGIATELAAGSFGGAAREVAEASGAPEWVQDSVEIAAPALGIPAAIKTAGKVSDIAGKLPGATMAAKMGRDVIRSIAPMSEAGAREVAKTRIQDLVGGEDRAAELGRSIVPDNEIGLTPAQQTGDERLMGLENAARSESPLLDEQFKLRAEQSRAKAAESVSEMGGDVKDARAFFSERLKTFKTDMQGKVDTAMRVSEGGLDAAGPIRSESANSTRVVDSIKAELDTALSEQQRLWGAVPKDISVSTTSAKATATKWRDELGQIGEDEMPPKVTQWLLSNTGLGDAASTRDMHRLYSSLRETARNAMAGDNKQSTLAKIANEVADSILDDLADVPALSEARAYSLALHNTFDQGAVGRILKRTRNTDGAIAPETALKKTVGRGGADAAVDAGKIEGAAPAASGDVQDYLRGRFSDAVLSADGTFQPKQAATWFRNNRELLDKYPELRSELRGALANREAADVFSIRTAARAALAEKQSAPAKFNKGQDEDAVRSILSADNPAKAARSVAAAARKDASGAAIAGVKGAFADYLVGGATKGSNGLSGASLKSLIADKNMSAALRQVFDADEMKRLDFIADQISRVDMKSRDVGGVLDSPANKLIEMAVRIAAVKASAGKGGGAGESLQIANMASGRAKDMLSRLTNDRARQMIMDAIDDPLLFRALMLEPRGVELPKLVRNKLAPYITGGAAQAAED